MKHSKWLLIVVVILLVINVVFYALWYALDVKGKVSAGLEAYLSKTLKGNFSIQKLSINDRHLTANNIAFVDYKKDIHLSIRQIQVRYNLFRVIYSGFKINKAIDQIIVYEPKVVIRYDLKPKKPGKPLKIPDLLPFFKTVEVNNGSLDIDFSTIIDKKTNTSIRVDEKLRNINIAITNRKVTAIKLTADHLGGGSLNLTSSLHRGLITKAKLKIEQFKTTSVQITKFNNLSAEIAALIDYQQPNRNVKPKIEATSVVRNIAFKYDKFNVQSPYTFIYGSPDKFKYDLRACAINGNLFNSTGIITDIFKQISLNSSLDITRIALAEIDKDLKGEASGKAEISLKQNKINATGNLIVPSLSYQGESTTNLAVAAVFAGDTLSFKSNEFLWREQASNVDGYFNVKSSSLSLNVKTSPMDSNQELRLNSDLAGILDLSSPAFKADIIVNNLSVYSPYANVESVHGNANFMSDKQSIKNILVELALENSQGISIALAGDLTTLKLKSVVTLDSINTYDYSPVLKKQKIKTDLSGKVIAELNGNALSGSCNLNIDMDSPNKLETDINSDFDYNFKDGTGNLALTTADGRLNEEPVFLTFAAFLNRNYLKLSDFNFDNAIFADGWLNTKDTKDFGLQINADSVSFAKYWQMYSPDAAASPFSSRISLNLDYNHDHDNKVIGFVQADSCAFQMIKPFNSYTAINGSTTNINLKTDIDTAGKSTLSVNSIVSRTPELNFDLKGKLDNFKIQDVLNYEKTSGTLDGTVQWTMQTKENQKNNKSSFLIDVTGKSIVFQDFPVDTLRVKVTQSNDLLDVEHLQVLVGNYFKLTGEGSLDYNIITNNYENGNHYLNLAFEGDVLKWLDRKVKFVEDAKGKLTFQAAIKASDEGLVIENGIINLNQGMVKLKDQVEKIANINLKGRIVNNELKLDKLNCQIGQGKLFIRNDIDPSGDNFFIGPLNLGYLLIRTDNTGIRVTMPDYMPDNTAATVVLKGQNDKREATVKGPFDDMEIKGEILVSNGNALYPADTNNLMQLITFFRKKTAPTEVPLPLTLDLMIILKENINYVTYPANLRCLPESFLHLTYDGNMWNAPEAEFQSEQGTLDFYGSTFSVEFVKLVLNMQQKITSLNGTFIRKAPDGTLVTLTVFTNLQKTGELMNQLEFKLSSDNPEDKTPAQILSRLRYNRTLDEITPEQRQSLIQDEAMQVIGTSVNSTYISQWLSPVENSIRKFLRLDSFTINTGFIQNLYLQYGTNNQQKVSFSDPKNLNSDIMQFSSSVFLNNLSLNMGKYLGYSIFLDYQIQMQEATDLAHKTKVVFYHNTTLRYNLPWKLRLSYTYSIKPLREPNSHEIMVQRTFRF